MNATPSNASASVDAANGHAVPWTTLLVTGLACAAITAVGYLLGVHPALAARADNAALEAELAQRQSTAAGVSSQLAAVRHRLEQTRRDVAALPLRLEPATAINRRLNRLAESAQAAGVVVHELQPSAVMDGPHYQTVPIRLAGSGTYPACAGFLHQLRTQFPDVTIRSFEAANPTVTRDQNSGAFRIELEWHTTPGLRK
jgi:Tfp pilus assembly protein PilO